MTSNNLIYRQPSKPGVALLGPLMEKYEILSNELAMRAEIPVWQVAGILKGSERINEDIAKRLSIVFGGSAELMLRMQKVVDFYEEHRRRPDMAELDAMAEPVALASPG